MDPAQPRLLQLFNYYLEKGGEEAAVRKLESVLRDGGACVEECTFRSADWKGEGAPPAWKQAALMWKNPASVAQLRSHVKVFQPDCLILHNVFPVGSAELFREIRRQDLPAVHYCHNYRPFSVNGYLWVDAKGPGEDWRKQLAPGGLKKNFCKEIVHGAWQGSVTKTALYAAILRGMHASGHFRAVRAWIAVSTFVKEVFVQAGIPESRVFTLPHPWSPRTEEPSPGEGTHFLFLGRLIEAKGVRMLVETWRAMGDEAPPLVIAGSGPLAGWVKEQAKEISTLTYAGHVSGAAKERLIEDCVSMLAPSLWWEPLGLVTYEAYDNGRPMLAARSGGLAETVQDGTTGYLHEPGETRQLTAQVKQLWADRAKAAAMGAAGRQWLLNNTGEDDWRRRFFEIVAFARENPA